MPRKKTSGKITLRLSKEDCEGLVTHMSKGLTVDSYAGVLGVTIEQLSELIKTNPKLKNAFDRGTAKSMLFWEQIGMASILGIKKVKSAGGQEIPIGAVNSQNWQFIMKSRFGYNDKQGRDPKDDFDIEIDLPEKLK